jgi:two-component system sensor histidine kinase PilS (NtrC family)
VPVIDPIEAAAFAVVDADRARGRALRYLNLFRLILGGLLLVAGAEFGLGTESPRLFVVAVLGYLGAVLALGFPDALRRLGFERVVILLAIADILALAAIMWVSGGYRSGMPALMMVMLAGAGLIGEGRMVMFSAALATLAVLVENTWRFVGGGQSVDFLQVGIFCAGFFGIALIARLLARRAHANASLAAERGVALAKQQAVSAHIIRDMQDGVIVVGQGGRILHVNPQALEMLGVARDERGALDGLELRDLDGRLEAVLQPELGPEGRLMRLGAAGRLLRCRRVPGEPGSAAEGDTLLYLTDYEEIQRQLQQIKLAALGRLTASMAHEIRNPLSAVTQAAELLRDEKRSDMQARLVRIINDNARRIERMIRDVLALGRREQAMLEALPLAAFLREVVEARVFREPAEAALYAIEVDPALTLAMDRAHLYQILDNLLSNAARHCSRTPAAIRLWAAAQPHAKVVLHVQDDGPGFDEATRAHLFEPFFTTHPKGTGLGLYIARELAEANDAELTLATGTPGADFVLTASQLP